MESQGSSWVGVHNEYTSEVLLVLYAIGYKFDDHGGEGVEGALETELLLQLGENVRVAPIPNKWFLKS